MQRVCAINIQNKREFICDIFFVYVVREVFLLCMYVYIFDLIFEKKTLCTGFLCPSNYLS